MISFIFRTDVHVSDKSPVSWKGDYNAEIFESLRQIGDLAREHQVTAVLDGGDYFHVKTPSRNSHGLIIATGLVHKEYPCPVYSIEGNHDLTGNNLATVDTQPLGVLYVSGIFKHLQEEVFESDGLRVRVVGVPYSLSRDLDQIQAIRKKPGDDFLIAIVHALASENPPAHVEEFFGEAVFRYQHLVYDQGPDLFAFGHWHRDQGVVQIEDRFFVNQGAVSRGSLTKENTERIPKVSLIQITKEDGISVRVLPLKVAPAEEVYDFERKERQEKESSIIEQFVSQLESDLQIDPDQDIEAGVASMNFAPEVRSRALAYLERARG